MARGTDSSWLIPFALGACSSLSILWLSNRLETKRTRQSSADVGSAGTNKHSGSANNTQTNQRSKHPPLQQSSQLMDAADLEHRILRKAEAVVQWRTTRLVVVVERCTNDHNYSAILRTVEALGIQKVYMIDPPPSLDQEEGEAATSDGQKQPTRTHEEEKSRQMHHLYAQNATEWLTIHDFSTTEACIEQLKQDGYQLWVTDLSQEAVSLPMASTSGGDHAAGSSSVTVPEKLALVMGTEAVGCSQVMLEAADLRVYLPLRGFADSLNLSVATALILHHLFWMDPSLIGATTPTEEGALRTQWYTKLCQQRLLTGRQKKERQRLQGLLLKCQRIHTRSSQNPSYHLQPSERNKLEKWDQFKDQLAQLETLLDPVKVQAAVQPLIDHPPEPLTDVRRVDDHRVCFVGKNTKQMHRDHWKDMVATSKQNCIVGGSADAFRGLMEASTSTNEE